LLTLESICVIVPVAVEFSSCTRASLKATRGICVTRRLGTSLDRTLPEQLDRSAYPVDMLTAAPKQITDTMGFLLGTWDLSRTIEDHRSGTCGLFEGQASLVAAAPGGSAVALGEAHYNEAGELRFGTRVTRAWRSLVYERLGAGAVMLHFTDGKPFVDLDLQSGEWRSVHHCAADLYQLTTTIRSHSVVQERWRVTGPSKDYVAVTTLNRIDSVTSVSERTGSRVTAPPCRSREPTPVEVERP
jgi:hypothetical protein